MKHRRWLAAALMAAIAGGVWAATAFAQQSGAAGAPSPWLRAYWRALGIRTASLAIAAVDAHTLKGLAGARCVVVETGQRVETGETGSAPAITVPVLRNPRLAEQVPQVHGQLTVICYRSGYRDAIHMGVPVYPGEAAEARVWMVPLGPGDARIEPTLHQDPIHRLFLIQLADRFRAGEEGAGPERPQLNRPGAGPAPQESMGGGVQTPLRPGPDGL